MVGLSPNLYHHPQRQPLESSRGSGSLSPGARVVIAVASLLALMILFFSMQGSDVSTKNGIARRRLPPEVMGQLGGASSEPLSRYASKTWIASQNGNDRYKDDRPGKDSDDLGEYPENDDGEGAYEDVGSQSKMSSPTASTGAREEAKKKHDTKENHKEHTENKKNKNKQKHGKKDSVETCDVNPAPPGVYVKGHGPCITQFPHQPAAFGGMDDCWRLAFAVAQWEQPKNPSKAEYGDDWEATAKAYPHTAKQAQQIVDDFNTKTELPISSEWSADHPYVRLCVPTECGLSKESGCDLRETDFLMHINPNAKNTDNTTHLFYKGFVRDGHLMLPNAGLTAH